MFVQAKLFEADVALRSLLFLESVRRFLDEHELQLLQGVDTVVDVFNVAKNIVVAQVFFSRAQFENGLVIVEWRDFMQLKENMCNGRLETDFG